jgi:hypothetical protein
VLLLSPTARIGGMMTGGLGKTDVGNEAAIGGASLAFFHAVCAQDEKPPCFRFPPHRALDAFEALLASAPGVTLLSGPMNADEFAAAHTMTPLQRSSTPDDIARAVLFLVDEAPYVTGHILNVDGGRSAHL